MKHTCPICGMDFYGYGNNPDPVIYDAYERGEKARRCCIGCNEGIVIPMRLLRMQIGLPPKLTRSERALLDRIEPGEERDYHTEKMNNAIMETYISIQTAKATIS